MGKYKEQIDGYTPEEVAALELKASLEAEQQQYEERPKGRLIDIIYNSFPHEQKEAQKDLTFSPSMLSDCRRKIYYNKTGEKQSNPIGLPSLLKMRWGNILHDDIQQILIKQGILESHEILKSIEYNGLTWRYKYDGIVNDGGERYLLELKTVYASGWKSIEDKPKEEHVLQAISYMIFENINNAIILYAGRDNAFLKQHKVQILTGEDSEGLPTQFVTVNGFKTNLMEVWRNRIAGITEVKYRVENRILPDRDFQMVFKNTNGVITDEFQKDGSKLKSSWQCSYCSHQDTCWREVKDKMKEHKFFIAGKFS